MDLGILALTANAVFFYSLLFCVASRLKS